jgi:two-component system OmpR family sensor kinase
LSKLITEATDEAKFIAPEFAFETDIENNIVASCDEYAIRRVMRILFSNAVKYSKGTEATDRRIEVNLSVSHGLAKIVVRDNGIGIAQEHLPLIFGRFYRVDESRSKKTGSSGLGLSIAWEIVSAHGGEIQAASALGEWTEFTVTLSM